MFVYYWKSEEITEDRNFHTELRMYGVDADNDPVCLRVEDLKLRFYLEFEDVDYLVNNFSSIKEKLASHVYNREDKKRIKLVRKQKLYGCNRLADGSARTFPYVELKLSSKIAMMSILKKIRNKDITFKCAVKPHEHTPTPEIQFVMERDINTAGWINVRKKIQVPEEEKTTMCEKEYYVYTKDVTRLDKNTPVDVKILAWDIEAKCKDISKNPGKSVGDCVFQISCVFTTSLTKKFDKFLLTLGECNEFADDVTILKFKTERDLILGFAKLVSDQKPNVMTGWNIFKFDTEFMLARAERNMCLGEFLTFGLHKNSCDITKIKWESKAAATTDVKYIDAEGILSIDLMETVRKNFKLASYKLNNVAKKFLGEEKDDIEFADIMYAWDCYVKQTENATEEMTKIGKYCVQDSKLVADLFHKLQAWVGLVEMSKTTSTPMIVIHLQGQQKKYFNQIYRYCYEEILVEHDAYKSKPTDRYAGAYVFDPKPGLYEYVEPLDFASLYPSIIIAYNIDYTTMVSEDSDIPEENLHVLEWEDHIGCEHDPEIIEKAKLTEMIEECNDKDKKAELRKRRAALKPKKNLMCQKNRFRFLKSEIYGKGVLPTIIQNLLDARKQVRSDMKLVDDEDLKAILDQRQLSYKISANSMYGATGVRCGALPFMPLAMCTTYIGRVSIQKAARIIKSKGGHIVYGDTDSNYITFSNVEGTHEEKCEKIWQKSLKLAEEISAEYPPPMRIEFEEVIYYKFMILTKKRYMYYSCKRNGEISKKIGQKGVLLARRDNSDFVKKIYENTVMNVFAGKNKNEVMEEILEKILNLLSLQSPVAELSLSKSINDYDECKIKLDDETGKYKVGNYIVPTPKEGMSEEEIQKYCLGRLPAQVQLEIKMVNKGMEKAEGSRLEFIVTDRPGMKKICEKIENYKFFMANRDLMKPDYLYYINSLVDPVEQIFDSIYSTNRFVAKSLEIFTHKDKLNKQLKKIFSPKLVEF